MATVKVTGAVVTRLIPNYGFKAVKEVEMRNGETKKETYTVWSTDAVAEGDEVDVVGDLSVKIEDFTNREGKQVQYAAIHINNPKVTTNAPF
jgi:uncharacterized Zn ribbon protein